MAFVFWFWVIAILLICFLAIPGTFNMFLIIFVCIPIGAYVAFWLFQLLSLKIKSNKDLKNSKLQSENDTYISKANLIRVNNEYKELLKTSKEYCKKFGLEFISLENDIITFKESEEEGARTMKAQIRLSDKKDTIYFKELIEINPG